MPAFPTRSISSSVPLSVTEHSIASGYVRLCQRRAGGLRRHGGGKGSADMTDEEKREEARHYGCEGETGSFNQTGHDADTELLQTVIGRTVKTNWLLLSVYSVVTALGLVASYFYQRIAQRRYFRHCCCGHIACRVVHVEGGDHDNKNKNDTMTRRGPPQGQNERRQNPRT